MDRSRERDQSVGRLLRQSLQAPRGAGLTGACLDAETLAAWVDGGLSGAPLDVAQAHVADCARCQTLVGAMARINSAVSQAEPDRAARRWLAWLVPATAAAAAIALWVVVPRETGARLPQAAQVQREAAEVKAQEPASLDDRSQAPASGARPSGAPASGTEEQSAQPSTRDERQPRSVLSEDAVRNEVAGSVQPPAQAPELRKDVARLEADSLRQQVPAPGAPAAATAPRPLAENTVGAARSAERGAEAAGIEIVSPDPSMRWRIAGSVVQRSTTGGSRWEDAPTGITAELTAGAAPSTLVCWVVGRAGVVLLSTDSRSWRRLAFPETTDLSAIRATDARAASVSTADGRTFSTTDGGVTWVRRPPQEF